MSFIVFDVPGHENDGGFAGTFPTSMNSAGVICGQYQDNTVNNTHGFIRAADGTITTFDVAGADNTFPWSINDSGVIAGYYRVATAFNLRGFVRAADGTITTFAPADCNTGSFKGLQVGGGHCINSSGQICGQYTDTSNVIHRFIRNTDGTFTVFTLGENGTSPCNINDSGEVAGFYGTGSPSFLNVAWFYSGGTVTTFQEPSAGTGHFQGTRALDINNSGLIVGDYVDSSGVQHLYIRDAGGTFTSFDPFAGGTSEYCYVNSLGQITGDYQHVTTGVQYSGFIRALDGTITSFDVTGAGTSSGEGTLPTAMNASGAVCGYIFDSSEVQHGFVGTPDTGPPPPPPPLRYKRLPLTLNLANTTFDQANRLLMYELYRSCGLDPSNPFLVALLPFLAGAKWQPPMTLVLTAWGESVDEEWNILKQVMPGQRITVDTTTTPEFNGDYEVMEKVIVPFQGGSGQLYGSESGGQIAGSGELASAPAQGAGKIMLTLRTYDENVFFDTSMTPSWVDVPGPWADGSY